jgi:triacylglycerol lipase
VHNNDIVTRVPPVFMGYRHCGNELYFDRHGRLRKLTGVWRSRDRWRGLIKGLWGWRLDMLSDHSIGQYAGHLAAAVDKENESIASNGGETAVESIAIQEGPDSEECGRQA